MQVAVFYVGNVSVVKARVLMLKRQTTFHFTPHPSKREERSLFKINTCNCFKMENYGCQHFKSGLIGVRELFHTKVNRSLFGSVNKNPVVYCIE